MTYTVYSTHSERRTAASNLLAGDWLLSGSGELLSGSDTLLSRGRRFGVGLLGSGELLNGRCFGSGRLATSLLGPTIASIGIEYLLFYLRDRPGCE